MLDGISNGIAKALNCLFPHPSLSPRDDGDAMADFEHNPLADMMQGLMNGNIWDMPMVQQVIFPSRQASAEFPGATSGPKRDGAVDVAPGVAVGFRAYVPREGCDRVALHFHGNAEVCGEADDIAPVFHAAGFALVSVDYRGYGWSTGSPGVTHLCGDADAVLDFLVKGGVPGIAEGCKVVAWGRSIGALSAVHLAASRAASVHGLVVDSGLMSIASLPMVKQLAATMGAGEMLGGPRTRRPPFYDAPEGADPSPVAVLHGDRDDIARRRPGLSCFNALGAPHKGREARPSPVAAHWDVSRPSPRSRVRANVGAGRPRQRATRTRRAPPAWAQRVIQRQEGRRVAPAKVDASRPFRARPDRETRKAAEIEAFEVANFAVVDRAPYLA
ncbi:hypothetical protein JL722_7153 [Aureococcus anophagefferens]|nr:hypothetical protein JL722_7153 [Aureococcus anophagefferens]